MKKINCIQMVLLSTLSGMMMGTASAKTFVMNNKTSHTLYYSIQCDPGLTNSAGTTYSVASGVKLRDNISIVKGEKHAHGAVCNIAIAPTSDATAYIKATGNAKGTAHCKVINTSYQGKKVACHIHKSGGAVVLSPGGVGARIHFTVTEK